MRFFLIAAAFLTLNATPAVAAGTVSPLNVGGELRDQDYDAIGQAVGASTVVSLGESIHLTREMPLVRLGVLRHLHSQMGFEVLAFEGALIDAWTAQENAYRSKEPLPDRARSFARQALFGLWQTDEMEKVIAYALSTQRSGNPLYLTSFDTQPGMARAFGGSAESSVAAFLKVLRSADPTIDEAQAGKWAAELGPALGCKAELSDDSSLKAIERWIMGSASSALAPQRPRIHLETLKLVPTMLRRRLEHCRQVASGANYQEMRDRHNAALVQDLAGQAGKIVLWAHHSHVHHNSLGRATPSMGQHLKAFMGERLYTLGVFASGGAAVDSLRADSAQGAGILFALASRPLPTDDRFEIENRLAAISDGDFFLNLRPRTAEWSQPSTSRLEVDGYMPTALSRDFDGAILLHEVTGAELNFLPPFFRTAVGVAGWILQNLLLAALLGLVVLAALSALIRRIWIRRRRRRGRRSAA